MDSRLTASRGRRSSRSVPGRGAMPDAEEGPVLEMARWRKKLFVVMTRNARAATEFFNIPPNRVVELGAQIEF